MEPPHPQLSITVKNGGEILGHLVIDSTIGGRACGGLRLVPDVDEPEIAGLARAMTLKFGYVSLPQGGGKSGVRGDPEAPREERRQRLVAFAHAIAPLLRRGLYAPFSDMGIDNTDIRYMLQAVGLPVKRRELRGNSSGYYTALSVMAGIQRGAQHIGLNLSRATVAIEGFGKVGGALGGLLDAAGIKVVAISTSRGTLYNPRGLDLKRLCAEPGRALVERYTEAEHLDRTALLELPVDVLCPCARHNTIHASNAWRIAAKLISPGANNPITPEAEPILAERSVLCLPYFVTNCGGALGGTMEFAMHRRATIERVIEQQLGARIARLLKESARQKRSPRQLAEEESRRRFAAMQQAAEHASMKARLFALGLECHRRGWLPGGLMRTLSLSYFEKRAGG